MSCAWRCPSVASWRRGSTTPAWRRPSGGPTEGLGDAFDDEDLAPAGSQRALGRLRRVADGIAAERRGYVRIATAVPPLGVPEGAVVAAFERVDLVEADPMAEIVVGGVSPDRALADHAFARRLHRRADTLVSIGPGPLVVAPDLASGVPADATTRAGRALALQLLGVSMARADGLAADRIVVGAYPAWLADESASAARILAEVTLRRAIFAGHPMRFDEPGADAADSPAAAAWPYLVAASVGRVGDAALVMRRATDDARRAHAEGRAAATVGGELASADRRRAGGPARAGAGSRPGRGGRGHRHPPAPDRRGLALGPGRSTGRRGHPGPRRSGPGHRWRCRGRADRGVRSAGVAALADLRPASLARSRA